MATKKAAKQVGAKEAVTHSAIVAATESDSFIYTDVATHGPMVAEGMVEVNPGMTNPENPQELATRATQKGIDSMNPAIDNVVTAPPVKPSPFKIDDAIALPTIKRGGRGGNVYPFEAMSVGQSFFVPADAAKPAPAKSLASTVSSATARYAVDSGEVETVSVKNYQMGEDGKRARGADGKLIALEETTETRPKMTETRKFVVRSVEENGVKGARVWRTA